VKGEGFIETIRNKRDHDDNGGTDDKRLLVVGGELGAALRACQRQGNTLSCSEWPGMGGPLRP